MTLEKTWTFMLADQLSMDVLNLNWDFILLGV